MALKGTIFIVALIIFFLISVCQRASERMKRGVLGFGDATRTSTMASFSLPAVHKFACFRKQVKRREERRRRGRREREKKIGEAQSVRWFRVESREISVTRGRANPVASETTGSPLRGTAKPLKNSDNTSPGGGAHLNVCIHTLVYRFDERCGQNYSN